MTTCQVSLSPILGSLHMTPQHLLLKHPPPAPRPTSLFLSICSLSTASRVSKISLLDTVYIYWDDCLCALISNTPRPPQLLFSCCLATPLHSQFVFRLLLRPPRMRPLLVAKTKGHCSSCGGGGARHLQPRDLGTQADFIGSLAVWPWCLSTEVSEQIFAS